MMHLCAQCRNSFADEVDPSVGPAEAEFYVEGFVIDICTGRCRPYRAYLCQNHVDCEVEDGAEFRIVRPIERS